MKTIKIMSKSHIRHKGSSILELAFVLPILLMFTLGIVGFGWLFLRVQQVTNAARHGARVAVRWGDNSALAKTEASALLDNVGLEHDEPIVEDSNDMGDAVTVTITGTGLDMLNLSNANWLYMPIPNSFTASVTMAKEGPY